MRPIQANHPAAAAAYAEIHALVNGGVLPVGTCLWVGANPLQWVLAKAPRWYGRGRCEGLDMAENWHYPDLPEDVHAPALRAALEPKNWE